MKLEVLRFYSACIQKLTVFQFLKCYNESYFMTSWLVAPASPFCFCSLRRTSARCWWPWTRISCFPFTQRIRSVCTTGVVWVNCPPTSLPLQTAAIPTCGDSSVTSAASSGEEEWALVPVYRVSSLVSLTAPLVKSVKSVQSVFRSGHWGVFSPLRPRLFRLWEESWWKTMT